MRKMTIAAGALVALMIASCGGSWPTEQDINNSLSAKVQSVTGDWTGFSQGTNPVTLDFKLQEGSNGQVSGTGTWKEGNASPAVPITVSGTFQRPALSLTFDGIVSESHQVKGVAQGNYTTAGGISTTLTLTGTGYTRDVAIVLIEK
ncbi:hypothetical protein Q4S45_07600 [Massilia sp. R2A-15]|uniref:hypothetical protein n=1 Tax=Massilia sp. R2A-15 TaxID=3064278 RepID=UPI0027338E14|nr:hypothetical protein [Massilia sp. R2A-15]WLI90971.1 hypothetical protein Q4S45_07600 [Massilia sp. R2A-15]